MSQAAFFVSDHSGAAIRPSQRIVVDVARRLLTRGDRPPADFPVETWALEAAGLDQQLRAARDPGDMSRRLSPNAKVAGWDQVRDAIAWRDPFDLETGARTADYAPVIDPDYEEPLFRAITSGRFGAGAGHWITPQPGLGPLLGAASSDVRRGDLLVCHPFATPAVVEVDGSQHLGAVEVDRDRDQAIAAAGLAEVRVKGIDEIDGAVGLVGAHLPATAVRPSSELLAAIWAPAVAARIARVLVEAVGAGWLIGSRWSLRIEEPIGVARVAAMSALDILAAVADVWGAPEIAPATAVIDTDHGRIDLVREGAGYRESAGSEEEIAVNLKVVIDPFLGPWHRLPGRSDVPTIVVRSACLPVDLRDTQSFGSFARRVPDVSSVSRDALVRLLQVIFAKREFYPAGTPHPRGQETALRRLLDARDTAVLLPTGAGKSLIYASLPGHRLVREPRRPANSGRSAGYRLRHKAYLSLYRATLSDDRVS